MTSGIPSSKSVSPFSILEILDSILYPEFFSKTFCNFVFIDLPWGPDVAIANFSETTFIMATELDRVSPFFSREVRAEDKNEKFDLIKSYY